MKTTQIAITTQHQNIFTMHLSSQPWSRIFLLLIAVFCWDCATAMEELDNEALSTVVGQAIFKVQDFKAYPQGNGQTLDFTRITFGAKIEINLNIDEIILGTYARPVSTDCTDSGRFCYSNDGWACATNPCGLDSDNAANNRPNSDIIIKGLSLGTVNTSTGAMEDFVYENPYLEFAYEGSGSNRKLVGARMGYHRANGTMGNVIEVLSGAIAPNVEADILGLGTGNIGRIPFFGARNKGYLPSIWEPLLSGLKSGPQLPAAQTVTLSNSRDMFLSLANRRISYPAVTPGVGASPTVDPGFWLNMMDGLSSVVPVTGIGPKPTNKFY